LAPKLGREAALRIATRVLLVLVSLCVAFLVTGYLASFTGAPLRSGGMEGTPVTVVVTFVVFPLSLIIVLVIGNSLINRYLRRRSSK